MRGIRVFSLALVLIGFTHGSLFAELPGDSEALAAYLKVTGKGRTTGPAVADSAEARLAARRAAILDGYRNMARLIGDVHPYLVDGEGSVAFQGFIPGAQVTTTRYLAGGWVEVDVELQVQLIPGVRVWAAEWNSGPGAAGAGVVVLDRDRRIYELEESDWLEMMEAISGTVPEAGEYE